MQFRAMAIVEDAKLTFRGRMQKTTEDSAFSHYLVCRYPGCGIAPLGENLLATNWPLSLLHSYSQLDVRSEHSCFGEFKSSTKTLRGLKLFDAANGDFSWTVAYTLFTAARHQYAFAISAPRPAASDKVIGLMILESMEHLAAFQASLPTFPEISQRETDCLYWAAAGKSSEDIGAILSLSSHTVNDYLKSAMRKLQSINRTQAVAKAIKLGVI